MMEPMNRTFLWSDFLPAFHQAAEAAGFSPQVLTDTAAGPLVAWERPADGPRIYLSAGIHGDEPAGPLALLDMMAGGFFTPDIAWAMCPALKPTGLAAGRRETAGGIDMNRDYWRRRTSEVAAHAAWLEARPVPDLFVSLHEDWETRDFYLYEINLAEDDPRRAGAIIDAVSPWFPPVDAATIDGHTPRGPGWIFHAAEADVPQGWPEAIFLSKHGCPLSFTLETPSQQALAARVAAHRAAVQAAIRHHRRE